MADVDTWMPLYIGDYLADTMHLTAEQHGAYLLLLMHYWRKGPLPDNDAVLSGIARMTPDAWSNARSMLAAFFNVDGGVWRHRRVDGEREKAINQHQARKAKAEQAAKARWGQSADAPSNAQSNASSNAPSMPEAMLEECPSPSPSPVSINENPNGFLSSAGPNDPCPVGEVVAAWNDIAGAAGLPTVRKANEPRKRAIRARWKDDWQKSLTEVREHFRRITEVPFCLGENDRGWCADLDYACKPKAFEQVRGWHQARAGPKQNLNLAQRMFFEQQGKLN